MAEDIPCVDDIIAQAKKLFVNEFKHVADYTVCAPGRVNLIGEHVDYNDGFVMPMALPMVTVIVGKRIPGEESTVLTVDSSADEPKKTTIEMPNERSLVRTITPGPPKWSNYIKGVLTNYRGGLIPAFEAVIVSSVPTGAGLSSSAALEVATYTFVDALLGQKMTAPIDIALACQKAEHDYAGVPCGIMDQFISVMGKKDQVLLIDCRSLTSTLLPFNDPAIVVLITNSNVRHELTGSEYSTRKAQCQQAALLLKKLSLRDATEEDIDYLMSINTDNDIVKRARHVVSEIKRTTEAADALRSKNYKLFGRLMTESHNSLRDDYNVSCPELDQLVVLALQVDGVLGSRMTGGGFGGCTVSLMLQHVVDKVITHIQEHYKGRPPSFYVCKASDGARIIEK